MTSADPVRAERFGHAAAVLRYLLCGGISVVCNWSSRFAFSLIMPFWAAVACAYLIGMITAFLMFRAFVFPKSPTPLNRQIRGFVLVNMLGLAQTWGLSVLLVDWFLPRIGWTFHAEALAHAAGLAAPTVTSWFGHRYLTFAQK
jgi:putative flippase GtrA